ncbi:hypothetical protein [Botrimarina hoheduenensis]|uniref:Uncharacterized protein n=1 Tax=Botrimarina hoheduenensis TaxID=2528000 RepID=A0A5C5WEK4_9BACT|nr:hypothetical protein [Botrimarina hoheduenensis]TWT48927.1 hypothetical protein Pla111_07050 [Botrimarina hoheduenensis]
MAKQPNHSAASLSGRPKAFSHVKSPRPRFQQAANVVQAKKPTQAMATGVKKQFGKAHEGPREKLAKPKKQLVPTPKGNEVEEVHTQVEREKQARNRRRDQQMKKWRERRIEPSHGARPKHELKKQTPDVHLKAEKKRQFQQMLQAKRAMRRGRGR